ncbi:MAG: hypothetical protein A2172_02270 [Candidatus Woykebacteria bacterium RBG_13_40_15]|uniref:Uncharacterized protein n=1 Tax=Candidatus Woykebacteria bacterium RBG_13_40_15 TaxID=1802593 RepID=A0A1G1W6C9_9BACT|nr:MAG: hypothetical protein A2172_02270 [Candidatus Woykebacteria bacterium RBG_13_40_15]
MPGGGRTIRAADLLLVTEKIVVRQSNDGSRLASEIAEKTLQAANAAGIITVGDLELASGSLEVRGLTREACRVLQEYAEAEGLV